MTDRSHDSLTQFYEQVHAPALIDIRPAGQMGASLLRVRQTPGDWSDPSVPDLVIAQSVYHPLRLQFDFGAGHVQMVARPGAVCVVPPDAATFFLMDDPHPVRFLTQPYRRLLAFAGQDCGLPPDGDFGGAARRNVSGHRHHPRPERFVCRGRGGQSARRAVGRRDDSVTDGAALVAAARAGRGR